MAACIRGQHNRSRRRILVLEQGWLTRSVPFFGRTVDSCNLGKICGLRSVPITSQPRWLAMQIRDTTLAVTDATATASSRTRDRIGSEHQTGKLLWQNYVFISD